MSKFQLQKAKREALLFRGAIDGPTGSGKTWTALAIATGLKGDKRVALIDTERSSSKLYAGEFDFDQGDLTDHSLQSYIETLESIDPEVYSVVVIDSLSHAWVGRGGALEQVDNAARRSGSGNTYFAWRDVTPLQNRLLDTLRAMPVHVIVTMRSKMAYEIVENERGKKEPKRLGLAPVQRDGVEYEFDFVADMTQEHDLVVNKTRFKEFDQAVINKPGPELGLRILALCGNAEEAKAGFENRQVTEDELHQLIEVVGSENASAVVSECKEMFGLETPRALNHGQFIKLLAHLKNG